MTWDQLEARWIDFAGSARAHWSRLDDTDWQSITGNRARLVQRIHARYLVSANEAERQVDEWTHSLMDIAPSKTRGSANSEVAAVMQPRSR